MKKQKSKNNRKLKQINDYDSTDTTSMVDVDKRLKFEDLGLELPETPPTQVVSIRIPTELLNELKALGSEKDVPYQALIKIFLSESIEKIKKKKSAWDKII